MPDPAPITHPSGPPSPVSWSRPRGLAEDPPPGAIRLGEVARLPLVIPSRPNAMRMRVESEMAAIGCRPNVALEVDGVPAILDLVADGAGHAILPRNAVTRSIDPSASRNGAPLIIAAHYGAESAEQGLW